MKYNSLVKKIIFLAILMIISSYNNVSANENSWWEIQSIDTMKYSRDIAREKNTSESFKQVIETQVRNIAETGATHVAIATPYDEEFLPFLNSWVEAARSNNLNVWYRGNWSGWEGWFDYEDISREEHIKKSVEFVNKNSDLFQDGDIFSACPECENGGPGDPRSNGDVEGHRKFLIDEYSALKNEFTKMGKNVKANFSPMNGDVAKLIMNKETTKALGGLVVVDHYVKTPEKLNADIDFLAASSGGKVFLGEFGAPIPDIHGNMNESQQADWLDKAMKLITVNKNLIGLNYWVNVGGSTEIWNSDNNPKLAVKTLSKYYKPLVSSGIVTNEIGKPISDVTLFGDNLSYKTDNSGQFEVKYFSENTSFKVDAKSYNQKIIMPKVGEENIITLTKSNENILFKIQKFFYNLFN